MAGNVGPPLLLTAPAQVDVAIDRLAIAHAGAAEGDLLLSNQFNGIGFGCPQLRDLPLPPAIAHLDEGDTSGSLFDRTDLAADLDGLPSKNASWQPEDLHGMRQQVHQRSTSLSKLLHQRILRRKRNDEGACDKSLRDFSFGSSM